MEGETTVLSPVELPESSSIKKTKILSLLLPADNKEPKKDKIKPPTKVIVRRLPPRLTEEALIQELSPIPEYDYLKFTRGDLTLGINAFSRANFNFMKQEDIFAFRDKFDNHIFKDERGREFHAVIEFAPFQKIPRKPLAKRKTPKSGTLETDPKYVEFIQKLEEAKTSSTNTSEYFHETEGLTSKPKVTTTPLLEYLKLKKQKKADSKNEMRQRMREAEWERRKNEEEKRRAKRDRRKEERLERKSKDDKNKPEDKTKILDKDQKTDEKNKKSSDSTREESNNVPRDPAILKAVIKQSDLASNEPSTPTSSEGKIKEPSTDSSFSKTKRYSDSRSKTLEEKQKKVKSDGAKHGKPDERGDNSNVGKRNEKVHDSHKKTKEYRNESKTNTETKSRYRYSEQRNRDREVRNLKSTDAKDKISEEEVKKVEELSSRVDKQLQLSSSEVCSKRRKSLDLENVDNNISEQRRSKSLHDVNDDKHQSNTLKNDNCKTEHSQHSHRLQTGDDCRKDPRVERRIRNKDRPSIEIYRPGMGKFSKQRIDQKKDDSGRVSPTNGNVTKSKKNDNNSDVNDSKSDESVKNEIRSMTFKRTSRE